MGGGGGEVEGVGVGVDGGAVVAHVRRREQAAVDGILKQHANTLQPIMRRQGSPPISPEGNCHSYHSPGTLRHSTSPVPTWQQVRPVISCKGLPFVWPCESAASPLVLTAVALRFTVCVFSYLLYLLFVRRDPILISCQGPCLSPWRNA